MSVSPRVADGLLRRKPSLVAHAMAEWMDGDGALLGQNDSACLLEAAALRTTLVTYGSEAHSSAP